MNEDLSQDDSYLNEEPSVVWEHEEVLQLIEIYKNNPELWDPNHDGYHHHTLRKNRLGRIAKSLGKTSRSVASKIRSLRTSYARMYGVIKEATRKHGSYSGTVWFGYESMDFLSKIYKKRTTGSKKAMTAKDVMNSKQVECSEEESEDGSYPRIYNELWKFDEILQLIDLYREHVELWDTEHVNYHHKRKKLKAIKNIAAALQKPGPEIKGKIKRLRTTFHKTDRKVKEAIETKGKFTGKLWFGYKRMSFLDTECAKICEKFLKPNFNIETSMETNTYSDDEDSRNYSWTYENVIKLIQMYKNHPELWDPDHEGFNNRLIRNNVMNTFAKNFQTNKYDIERKIKGIRCQFIRQHKAVLKAERGEMKYPAKLWFGYKNLSFLTKVNDDAEFVASQDENHTIEIEIKQEPFEMENDTSLISEDMLCPPPKRKKHKHIGSHDNDPLIVDVEHDCVKNLEQDNMKSVEHIYVKAETSHCCSSLDEFTTFGQFVSEELKKIKDEYALMMAKSEISSIIFKAQMQQGKILQI